MLHVIFLSVTLVTNWQTVGLIYVTAANSYTELKLFIVTGKYVIYKKFRFPLIFLHNIMYWSILIM